MEPYTVRKHYLILTPLTELSNVVAYFCQQFFQEYASWTCWQTHTFEPPPSSPRMSFCWWPPRGDQCFGNQSFASLNTRPRERVPNERQRWDLAA
jgi:hypothetical protein